MKLLLVLVISFQSFAGEKYVLPKAIVEARDEVLKSKEELDRNMLLRYEQLCYKDSLSMSEKEESLAYQSIFIFGCEEFVVETQIEMP